MPRLPRVETPPRTRYHTTLPLNITNRIPRELMDLVVDNLRYDRGALYSYMLVCRAWYLGYQRLLCCHVVIGDHRAFKALRQYAIERSSAESHLTTTHFLAVIGPQKYPRPLTLSRYMPNLRCLHLTDFRRMAFNRPLVNFVSQFTALEHLFLSNFTLHSFGDLHRLIVALPHIRELSLVKGRLAACSSRVLGSAATFIPKDAPHLHMLHLDKNEGSLLALLAEWIEATGMYKSMTRLALSTCDSLSATIASHMMQALGPSLTHLEYLPAVYPDSIPSESLSFCTQLRGVRLALGNGEVFYPLQPFVDSLHGLISSLCSTVIRTIELHIRSPLEVTKIPLPLDNLKSHTHGPTDERDPERLHNERGIHHNSKQPQFNSLRRVTIHLHQQTQRFDESNNRIRSILAPWDARGILAVDHDKFPH